MAIISNGTTIASGGSLSVSANPPTTAGAIGTYGVFINYSTSSREAGNTQSGSTIRWVSCADDLYEDGGTVSGTWRIMGRARDVNNNNTGKNSIYVRIS